MPIKADRVVIVMVDTKTTASGLKQINRYFWQGRRVFDDKRWLELKKQGR